MTYGLQKAIISPLLAWYQQEHRSLPWRSDPTPYHVWVSEIMLQQTRVEAVKPYFVRWMNTLPTISSLADAPEDVYMKLWEGLGYYSRVRNLHRAATEICEKYSGMLPSDYQTLLTLPGIGEYTAGAIASIAFGVAVPAVDGNVLRVAARLDNDYTPITDTKYKKSVREKLLSLMPKKNPGDFNQALMELGATICLPNGAPLCDNCPLMHLCGSFFHQATNIIPIKTAKKARRIEKRTVLLLVSENTIVIQKRPQKGLLAGLWEFPHLEGHASSDEVGAFLSAHKLKAEKILSLPAAKHIFTHVEWHMTGYYIVLSKPSEDYTFVSAADLQEKYSIPSAFRAFLSVFLHENEIPEK